MNPATDRKKLTALSLGLLAVLLLAAFLCWAATDPQALESVKEITVTVTHSEEFLAGDEEAEPFEVTFETTARTLTAAMEDREELLFVPDREGMTLVTADGETADLYRNQRWVCYQSGELLEESLDEHELEDGDAYYFYLVTE